MYLPDFDLDRNKNGIISIPEMIRLRIPTTETTPSIVGFFQGLLGDLFVIKETVPGSIIVPVTGPCDIVVADNAKTFNDVADAHWAKDNISFVTAREIFNGVGEGNFAPETSMNRAMLAQVLYNYTRGAEAGDASVKFDDVNASDWFCGSVGWAAANGIVQGYGNGRFGTDDPVLRGQLGLMLTRLSRQMGVSYTADVMSRDELTRAQTALILYDFAMAAGLWAN